MATEESKQSVRTDDGVNLAVHIWNAEGSAGAPRHDILLLHGFPTSGKVWTKLVEALALAALPDVSLRLVAPDLRGYGESDKPTTGYTVEQFASDVLSVAHALQLKDYLLVGHSMSGKTAQVVAAQAPPNLASVVLLAPTPLAAGNVPEEKRAAQRDAYGDREKTAAMILGMFAHKPDPEAEDALATDGLRMSREAWNGWVDAMREEDLSDKAAAIQVPVLVVAPTRDPLRTPEVVKEQIADKIPHATFATIPAVGHFPHIEDPIVTASLLINYLEGLPKGAGL